MNKLFPIATIHCHLPKNAGFDVKNDVISGVLFPLKLYKDVICVSLISWGGSVPYSVNSRKIHVHHFLLNFAYKYLVVSCFFYSNLNNLLLTIMTSRTSKEVPPFTGIRDLQGHFFITIKVIGKIKQYKDDFQIVTFSFFRSE